MRLMNVCHLSALSAVLASLIVISSAGPRTPLHTRKGEYPEVKREQPSLSSDETLWPRPLAERADINDLVSKELGQGWTVHVVKYYALVPVNSAAQALESYELQSDPLPAIAYESLIDLALVSTATSGDRHLR